MKKQKPPAREPVKLHIDPTPVEPTAEYTLEDIMNEFGGWSKRPETSDTPQSVPEATEGHPDLPQPQRAPQTPAADLNAQPLAPAAQIAADPQASPEPDVRIAKPENAEIPEDSSKDKTKNSGETQKKTDLSAETMRFSPVMEQKAEETEERPIIWTYKGEPTPEQSEKDPRARLSREELRERQRLKKLEYRQQKREKRKEKRQEKPERTFASPEEAYAFYCKPDSLRLRLLLSALLTLASSVFLILTSGLISTQTDRIPLFSALMLICLLLQGVLCLDVLADGVFRAIRLKFDLNSLLVLVFLASAADTVFALMAGRIPFCTVVSIELSTALWSRLLLKSAKYKTLKAVCSMPTPVAAVRKEAAWHGMDCIFRAPGDRTRFVAQLEMPDAAARCARIYAPIIAVLTMILSVFTTFQSENNFLWSWTAMLLASFPAGLFLSYSRTFQRQSVRLYRYGAALPGWAGVRVLSGECAATITDQDLFPAGNVTLNGMKIYSDRSASQIIGFASAVVQTAGSGLAPLFDEMMHSQNGRHYRVDTFRRYEGGGLGAEIQGDVILMGSIGFMKLMKVQMPEGTRLKQAVYLSVNGELAAVFALNYAPAAGIRSGLSAAAHTAGLLPLLATRDFMITPQFLKLRYKIAPDRVEFPTVEERARLSEPDAGRGGAQGAMLARESFEAFAAVISGARGMRGAALGSIAIAVMGGVMGMLVLFFLTFLGATLSASCWNLFLYTLLWLVPGILVTSLSTRR